MIFFSKESKPKKMFFFFVCVFFERVKVMEG